MNNKRKIVITESEKQNIKKMYEPIMKKRDYIFEMCVSIDGRYFIIQDEIYDNVISKSIGNIWESIDKFKTIFSNIDLNDEKYHIIKENILQLPILESKETLYGLRDILLEFNFLQDTWFGRELSKTGKGISDFVSTSYDGLKKFGLAISKGQWSEILNLISKGVVYIFRKLKDALYSNVGMIVDSILIATGVGKGVQWIPWAMITGLDIYQLSTNNWPEEESADPMWVKYLTLGFDILGLISTGIFAKSAKSLFTPLKKLGNNTKEISKYVSKNTKLKTLIEQMISGISKVPSKLSEAIKIMGNKFPMGSTFLTKVLGYLKNITNKFINTLRTLLGDVAFGATKAGTTTTGILYGIDKLTNNKTDNSAVYDELLKNNVEPDFTGLIGTEI